MDHVPESPPMAKPKGRPRKPSGEGVQVRIEADLASKARLVAAEKGITVLELLSAWIRPPLMKEFRKMVRAEEDEK